MIGKLLGSVTVKGLAYAVAVLLALLLATGIGWRLHAASLRAQLTDATVAKAGAEQRARDAAAANTEWQDEAEVARQALAGCTLALKTEELDAAAAIALATQRWQRASSDLTAFERLWQDISQSCAAALANADHACAAEIPRY